ncbi:pseudouridine synthase [Shewanella denitrificans OS217]|jgi:tRNA pseudouridine32 synthase / 23S rRNA pseudouridine746 synthase|uniref:Pseudouridine synthase n=2 Tax=Shewanella TaxID=22 RepID=Q12QH4_SHEDO|nr:pseudouridine synthase [Shewanella denitrificans OS217]
MTPTMTSTAIDTFIAPPCLAQIQILYEDEAILAIDKPSGLLSLSGKNPLNLDSVHYRLVQDFADARLLHRLDFGTSGIILVARNKHINGLLTQQFQNRSVTKTYQALLMGKLSTDSGVIDAPIAKDAALFPRLKICELEGKSAMTEYKVLSYCEQTDLSRVQFTPITGRTHQLRLHSQHLGHPILGCDLYGGIVDGREPVSRMMLHAQSLAFTHPLTGGDMQINCPCPF